MIYFLADNKHKFCFTLNNFAFLAGNIHKWGFAARGCAIQYANPKYHDDGVAPVVTSFDYGKPFPDNHVHQGTKEDSRYIAAEEALKFYQWIGGMVRLILIAFRYDSI